MSDSMILARIKRNGKTFEISIDPHQAVAFKEGRSINIADALKSDHIFIDAKRGQCASSAELEEIFKTTNTREIAEIIITKGELQSTSDQRKSEREQKRNALIQKIHTLAVDPKTNLPHPITRINAALTEAKVQIRDNQSIDSQFESILSKLRPIIPLKIEQKQLKVTIAAQHVGALNHFIRTQSKLIKEEWTNTGAWQVTIEVPAGLVKETIDTLNAKTSAACEVTFIE